MNLYTEQGILDRWDRNMSTKERQERYEMEALKKDVETARRYIRDALKRYRKDKLPRRSKSKADPFADLAPYKTREQIRDDFGWDIITEAEMDRLMDLWDLREQSSSQTELKDRVTELLERAIYGVSGPYNEKIDAWDRKERDRRQSAREIAAENFRRSNRNGGGEDG